MARPVGLGEHGPVQSDRFIDPIPPKLAFVFVAYFIRAYLRGAFFGGCPPKPYTQIPPLEF